jgi:hypothetical protein
MVLGLLFFLSPTIVNGLSWLFSSAYLETLLVIQSLTIPKFAFREMGSFC